MPGIPLSPLQADDLIDRARRRSGLTDFGAVPFRPGLEAFLSACREEAQLGAFGYFGTRWDVVRFLSNLLRMHREELRAPRIAEETIDRPIFIAGLPRSGTTYLHALLSADPANRVPRVWELVFPYPPLDAAGADRRQKIVARQLFMFRFLAPSFHKMHPIGADSPQECSEITAHIFASLRFDTTHRVPSYRRWLDGRGHLDAYCFHKRFLQHLQHQQQGVRPDRWVLKCPDHIFALEAIRQVYPDARLVLVHRDPLRVLPSLLRLTETLRRPFTRRIDRTELVRQESDRWLAASSLMIEAADREPFTEPIFHLKFADLVRDPTGTVRRLYGHFGLPLSDVASTGIARLVEQKPNGGYGGRRSSLESYSLDPAVERTRFSPYMQRFGLLPEAAAGRASHARAVHLGGWRGQVAPRDTSSRLPRVS